MEDIKNYSKEETLDFIRKRLKFDNHLLGQLRHYVVPFDDMFKEHKRFEMSGYDGGKKGSCTIHNQNILNLFADLGIYDYTYYLSLDFCKGNATLYFRYWDNEMDNEYEFDNIGTVEVIYEIFQLTILSGMTKRRR